MSRGKRKGFFRKILRLEDHPDAVRTRPSDSPDTLLEAEERRRVLRRALDTLPENQRAAFVLSKYDGLSYRGIAEVLGSEVYEKTQLMPLDFFQKNCGILVKNSLRHEGISVEK